MSRISFVQFRKEYLISAITLVYFLEKDVSKNKGNLKYSIDFEGLATLSIPDVNPQGTLVVISTSSVTSVEPLHSLDVICGLFAW